MILCNFYQWLWSLARDSGSAPAASVRRHMARCGRCRAAADAMEALDSSLRLPAAAPGDAWLQEVLGKTARIPPPLTRPLRRLEHPLRLALTGAAVILVAALLLRTGTVRRTAAPAVHENVAGGGQVVPLTDLAMSLEHESAALERDFREAARIATYCLPF